MCECSACITWNRSVSFGSASRSLRIFRSPLLTRLPNCCDAPLFRSTMFKCIGHVLDSFTLFDHTRACVQCTSTFVHTHQSPVRSMEILNAKWVVTRNQEHTLKKKTSSRQQYNAKQREQQLEKQRTTGENCFIMIVVDGRNVIHSNSNELVNAHETIKCGVRCTYISVGWPMRMQLSNGSNIVQAVQSANNHDSKVLVSAEN